MIIGAGQHRRRTPRSDLTCRPEALNRERVATTWMGIQRSTRGPASRSRSTNRPSGRSIPTSLTPRRERLAQGADPGSSCENGLAIAGAHGEALEGLSLSPLTGPRPGRSRSGAGPRTAARRVGSPGDPDVAFGPAAPANSTWTSPARSLAPRAPLRRTPRCPSRAGRYRRGRVRRGRSAPRARCLRRSPSPACQRTEAGEQGVLDVAGPPCR